MTIESNGEIIARQPRKSDSGNHYEGCWRMPGHHNCAVAEIERLRELVTRLGGTPVREGPKRDA